MFRSKFVAAVAALTLTGAAFVGLAGPASADDETEPIQPTTSEVASETPAVEPAPAEPAAEEPAPAGSAPPATPPAEQPPAEEPPAEDAGDGAEGEASTPEDRLAAGPVDPAPLAPTDANPSALRLTDTSLAAAELLAEPVKKVQFCHATASDSNPYTYNDTSVNAFFNSGHHEHQNFEDIVPPFSYEKQGKVVDFPGLNWDAEGQAIFYNGCKEVVIVPGVATASVFTIPASCTAPEQLVLGTTTNATWGPITDPAGPDDYSVTATATNGALFAGNLTSLTFTGQLDPINTGEECDNTLVKKVQLCHATASDTNPWEYLDISVNAFFNAGHDTHQDNADIIPPFSYVKNGEVIDFPGQNWDAEGQALFLAGCEEDEEIEPLVATASISFKPATCTTPEELVLGAITNATWGEVTDPLGDDDYYVVATAVAGALFAGGLTEKVFHGELDDIDMSEDCDNTLTKKVQFCHSTESETNPYEYLDTSVNAFFNAGHDFHHDYGDIVPPFSYVKFGEVIDFPGLNWDEEGQAIFENGCENFASATVSFLDPTCFLPQQLVLGTIVNASWGPITQPGGMYSYSVTATADKGALFPGKLKEITFEGELEPPLPPDSPECQLPPFDIVTPEVSFTDATCTAGASYTLGVAEGFDPADVTFTVNGTPNVPSGTYPTTDASVTVTVQAVPPHGLDPEWVNPPTHEFPAPVGCTSGGGGSGVLAHTGAVVSAAGIIGIGGGLLFLGIVAMIMRRRQTTIG